jgi:hypothetical protein
VVRALRHVGVPGPGCEDDKRTEPADDHYPRADRLNDLDDFRDHVLVAHTCLPYWPVATGGPGSRGSFAGSAVAQLEVARERLANLRRDAGRAAGASDLTIDVARFFSVPCLIWAVFIMAVVNDGLAVLELLELPELPHPVTASAQRT